MSNKRVKKLTNMNLASLWSYAVLIYQISLNLKEKKINILQPKNLKPS
jgi:hypothetical protein